MLQGKNGELVHARVDRRAENLDGKIIVIPNKNIFNDQKIYEVYYIRISKK